MDGGKGKPVERWIKNGGQEVGMMEMLEWGDKGDKLEKRLEKIGGRVIPKGTRLIYSMLTHTNARHLYRKIYFQMQQITLDGETFSWTKG